MCRKPADCKSAIRQIANLRYVTEFAPACTKVLPVRPGLLRTVGGSTKGAAAVIYMQALVKNRMHRLEEVAVDAATPLTRGIFTMGRTSKSMRKPPNAERQLQGFINKFEPAHRRVIRAARQALRAYFPAATELVYDNYNFFVIGFGPNERPSDCIVSLTAAASGVGLCFLRGARLPDPAKLLLGSGKQTRFIRLPSAELLEQPHVQSLLGLAAAAAKTPMPRSGRGKLVIRSVSVKQRPRRKATRIQQPLHRGKDG